MIALLLALLMVTYTVPTFAQGADVRVGGDIKVQGVYVDNVNDFDDGDDNNDEYESDDQEAFIRSEAHLWGQADLADNVSARVSVEADRTFSNEDGALYSDSSDDGYGVTSSHGVPADDDLNIFLEEAWIDIRDIGGYPVSAKIGRQFFELGDGFVFGDALPGSPALFSDLGDGEQDPFDMIRVDIEPMENVVLTLAYTKAAETRNVQRDIDIYLANLAWNYVENHTAEIYYMYYNDDGNARISSPVLDASGEIVSFHGPTTSVDVELHQIGLRLSGKVVDELKYNAEGTFQFADQIQFEGTDQEVDIQGWAATAGLTWEPQALADNNVALGASYTYLSGDDTADDENEAYWQIIDNRTYGEIGDFMEGLVVNNSGGLGYTGVHAFNIDGKITVMEKLNLGLEAFYFLAAEDVLGPNNEDDDDIGFEVDGYLGYDITENLTANLASGFFAPGDATENWTGSNDADTAWFVRGGVTVSF
jgi:hypothetical protein